MIPLAVPIVSGVLGAVGGMLSNRANAKMADKQMRFQERMSSTAAQRSVKDYEAAGLNPALAYDRPASSPGGSMAQQEDVVGKGVSSAMAAATMREQLSLLQKQTAKMGFEARSAEVAQRIATNTEEEATQTAIAKLRQEREMLQPSSDLMRAQLQLLRYEMTGAKNEAELQKKMGIYGNILRFIKPR